MILQDNQDMKNTIVVMHGDETGEELLVSAYPPRGNSGVYVLSIDGQDLSLVFSEAWAGDWSPDGQEIVVGDLVSGAVLVIGPD